MSAYVPLTDDELNHAVADAFGYGSDDDARRSALARLVADLRYARARYQEVHAQWCAERRRYEALEGHLAQITVSAA